MSHRYNRAISLSTSPMITIRNLSKTYIIHERTSWLHRRERQMTALQKVNLTIAQGELFGLLGPNGAGKTTLLKCLTTLLIPSQGHISVNGFMVGQDDVAVRRSLGCLLNGERSLYGKLTGHENLTYYGALYHLTPAEIRTRINWLADLLKLAPLLDRPVETCSAGQKMILALARALMNQARILILDEPTNALDVPAAQQVRQLVQKLHQEGFTIILTSHHMAEIEALCQRVAIVDHGRVIADGTIAALKADLTQTQAITVEGIIPAIAVQTLREQPTVQLVTVQPQADQRSQLTILVTDIRQCLPLLLHHLFEQQAVIEHIAPATVTLEDVFMAKTGRSLNQETELV